MVTKKISPSNHSMTALPVLRTDIQPPAFPTHRTRGLTMLCLALVFGVAGILDLIVAASMSPTTDEPDYISYGIQVLHLRPDRSSFLLWNSKTPVSALNAAPQVAAGFLERHHFPRRAVAVLHQLRVARVPSVIALLLLNWFVYRWVYELYGVFAALAVSVMVILSPNLIAHGTLATNDGYFSLGVVASLYFVRRYILQPTWRNAWLSALVLALAQLTKPFAFYLYVVVFGVLLFRVIRKSGRTSVITAKQTMAFLAIAIASFIGVLNVGYAFDRSFAPLRAYDFQSVSFRRLQTVPLVRNVRVPVPYAYLQGLDLMKYCDDIRVTFGNIYLLSGLHRVQDPAFRNFKSYYLVAMFFKEPIALQILFALGILWICRNHDWDDFLAGEGLLLAAAVALVLWQSLLRNSQIGIRNILPALAIEVMIGASVFANFSSLTRGKKIVLALLLAWLGASTFSYFPQMIPYMNEWVLDRRSAYKILADSNIDWGQNERLVEEFLRNNSDVKLNPETPVTGRVLVSVNRLVGVDPRHTPPNWLLQYQPVAHVGYAHLLYVIPPG
jgi:hypothetical protein